MPNHAAFSWKFHRIGGLDQVTLRTPEELLHLDELDPKLWVALSCPIDKLQFDARTLELLDADKDGRIRIQEVLGAVRWTVARLSDPALLAESRPGLALEEIRQDTDEGRLLYAAASRILTQNGKEGPLTQEDVMGAIDAATQTAFNGDGVMTPHPSFAPDINRFIEDIITTTGGATDVGGQQGATLELAQTFMRNIQDYKVWFDELAAYADTFPLGSGTDTAFRVFQSVQSKIDDYFTRCQLVAFDVRASDALNAPETVFAQLVDHDLNTNDEAMRELPLAHIAADQPLPLEKGLNPAWRDQIITLKDTIAVPLLGVRDELTSDKWQTIKTRFAPYAELVARKPESGVEQLGMERLEELLSSDLPSRFEALAQQDEEAAGHLKTLTDVERLVLYHHHLHRLLMNFVSFCDFYALSRPTTFQIGTLFIDGRGCNLCLRVDDITSHAAQAQPSHLCLAYCECSRPDTGQKMNIVAAVTAGDSNLLLPGRHGVFVDTQGQSWEAVLVKLVDNPISIRTAMFAPYKRFGRMITDQLEKLASSKDSALMSDASKSIEKLATDTQKDAKPFDIGRSMGIFAAIGLALGAIGTALASIAAALFALSWWQFPLLFLGIFLCISGPSMFLAWLKLRRRTLGPVLDASGWAVNSQIPINFMLGSCLTDAAALPPNASRSFDDPFRKQNRWKKWAVAFGVACLAALLAGGGYWGWKEYQKRHPATQEQASDIAAPKVPAPPVK